MSLSNLLQLLDTDSASGKAPFFSLPLASAPNFPAPVTGTLELGASVPLLASGVGGTVPIRIETDAGNVTRLVVDGNPPPKIKDGVRIDLVDGIEIGVTRVDDLGQSWLDLRFLALFSNVTQGQNLLTTVFNMSEGAGRFFLRFGNLPLTFAGAPVGELQANVLLDKAPNFAPWLDLGAGASARSYTARAGRALDFGSDFFFSHDTSNGHVPRLALIDPIVNLAATTPVGLAYTAADDWLRPASRPVLMAKPAAGALRVDGENVQFPTPDQVQISLDLSGATGGMDSGSAIFVKLGGAVFRTLAVEELAHLEYVGSGTDALLHAEVPLTFFVRDAQGAMSGEFVASVSVQSARVSGTVSHWSSNAPIERVAVSLQKSDAVEPMARTVASSTEGQWQFEGLDFDRFNLHAARVVEPAAVQSALSSVDALAALKLAVGRDLGALTVAGPPSLSAAAVASLQCAAADFDRDGVVGVDDAESIMRVLTGEMSANAVDWRFIPTSALPTQSVATPVLTGTPFVPNAASGLVQIDATNDAALHWLAVLVGDVDGSWRADAGYPAT